MSNIAYLHSEKRLTYALNNEGKIIGVNDVPTGLACQCICPACKESLVAKNNGIKRIHHFAHLSGADCPHAVESMLHILAKERIRKTFLSNNEFWIEFEHKSFCTKNNDCEFIRHNDCYDSSIKKYNLKDFYDCCEQEISYDNINRRSDLKIFSSKFPDRKPIYLEFHVTHASDIEKLHSGNKIIEIFIESEDDINLICQQGGISELCHTVTFYGFNNNDLNNQETESEIEFTRFILYKSGKMLCTSESCSCKQIKKSKPFSLLEVCIHSLSSYEIYERMKYIGFQQFGIKNCNLCMNYVDSYNLNEKICRLYKHLQITRYQTIDTSRAIECKYFQIDQQLMDSAINNGLEAPYTIFK
jgi:hypothetical protein